MDFRNQERETSSGCVSNIVYSRQRKKKIETTREVIEIGPKVDFANQEGEIDSRHGTKIAADAHHKNKTKTVKDVTGSVSSIFSFPVPRGPRTKIKRKFKGNKTLARSKEELNSEVFDNYLAKVWESFSEDRKRSFAYMDGLWFSLYRGASYKDKVLSWIDKKNIFTKAYVFVPIVLWGHWNLLIFCHFDENLQSATGSRCMLLLDSLEKIGPRRLEPDIRKFVQDIYKVGNRPETKDLISRIPLLVPKVPQQKDDTDCGNFVLYFIKLFLEFAPENFSMEGYPYFMKKDWFTFEDLDRFCENLVR
ncbi:ubiquitin-like-specific protease 1C [Medicago truncatula]|uniref:ubiquitin-like-specific protease 1C n=1 Tax=Medicago truncatula TaxID=3880 RepID=UPI000D2F1E70|nr:ubiquitin-like-specific protease 1C [Medicago truncatula]